MSNFGRHTSKILGQQNMQIFNKKRRPELLHVLTTLQKICYVVCQTTPELRQN